MLYSLTKPLWLSLLYLPRAMNTCNSLISKGKIQRLGCGLILFVSFSHSRSLLVRPADRKTSLSVPFMLLFLLVSSADKKSLGGEEDEGLRTVSGSRSVTTKKELSFFTQELFFTKKTMKLSFSRELFVSFCPCLSMR